ncbi:MAG: hypothetical protein VW802_01675 [Rhodospirillaceae bacterium]|jgi:hypothetical protein
MNLYTSNFKGFIRSFFIITVIVLLIFITCTELLIRVKVIPHHNDYKYFDLFNRTSFSNASFGDSHVAYGISGLPNFVNLAYGGNSFLSISGKARAFYSKRSPDKVILQAGPHHFSRGFLDWRPDETKEFINNLHGHPWYHLKMLQSFHRIEIFNYWITFLKKGEFKPQKKFMPDGSRLSSIIYTYTPDKIREESADRIFKILRPVPDFKKSSVAKEYKDVLIFLKQKKADVCLVTLPIASTLRRKVKKDPLFQETFRFFERLAKITNVKYVNLYDYDIADNLFSDAHHLNGGGAQLISKIIFNRCYG